MLEKSVIPSFDNTAWGDNDFVGDCGESGGYISVRCLKICIKWVRYTFDTTKMVICVGDLF